VPVADAATPENIFSTLKITSIKEPPPTSIKVLEIFEQGWWNKKKHLPVTPGVCAGILPVQDQKCMQCLIGTASHNSLGFLPILQILDLPTKKTAMR
jgi:hypothetical protein